VAAPGTLPRCDVLVLSWGHTVRSKAGGGAPVDPMWAALTAAFKVPKQAPLVPYERGFNRVLGDLSAYNLVQVWRDRGARLRPARDPRFGRYVMRKVGGRDVCLFDSDVRLNTGGPSLPVRRMLDQLLDEAQPRRCVVSVGFGGGVNASQRAGDVVIATSARYRLAADLAGFEQNDEVFGGRWQPPGAWFDRIAFGRVADPQVVAPSPNYRQRALDRPAALAPLLSIDARPVATAPLLTEDGFFLGAPGQSDINYLGKTASATDMDAAPVAAACDRGGVNCAFVVGLVVPLLMRYDYDYRARLRRAWADHYFTTFAQPAAENAARTVYAMCSGK
jgi:nucleoside phosphorylase